MDSIDFILKKDSEGNDIHLDNMSLAASKSLREILDALIKIAEYEPSLNLSIGLEKGSAAEKIIGNEENIKIVYNKFVEASNLGNERDNKYVSCLNVIYNNVEKTQDYEILYKSRGTSISLKPLFESKFKIKRANRIENNFKLEFFNEVLELNGGKNPNFHFDYNGIPITIQCSREQAKKVNPFLYEEIKISAWARSKSKGMEYEFCDIYVGESEVYFTEFKNFYNLIKDSEGTQPFHLISEKLEEYYSNNNYSGAKKFIRLFLNRYSLPIYLRTILVISKGFKDDEYLKDILEEVEILLSKKIGKIY